MAALNTSSILLISATSARLIFQYLVPFSAAAVGIGATCRVIVTVISGTINQIRTAKMGKLRNYNELTSFINF